MCLDQVGAYYGNVSSGEKGWTSFDFKYITSLKGTTRLTYDQESPALKEFMINNEITLIEGDRWGQDSKPLWFLRYSLSTDDSTKIKRELINHLVDKGYTDLPAFNIEWHRNTDWLQTNAITTEGWCICGGIREEDTIYDLFSKFEERSPAVYPLTHSMAPSIMYSAARFQNPVSRIDSELKLHDKWTSKTISITIEVALTAETRPKLLSKIYELGKEQSHDGSNIIVRVTELAHDKILVIAMDDHIAEIQQLAKAVQTHIEGDLEAGDINIVTNIMSGRVQNTPPTPVTPAAPSLGSMSSNFNPP